MRPLGAPTKQETDRLYDRTRRNPRAKKFYDSATWKRLREWFLAHNPFCEQCWKRGDLIPATEVHHTEGLGEDLELAFDDSKLAALCKACHSSITMREVHDRARESKHARNQAGICTQGRVYGG
jgi:hypothetical protein